MNPLQQIHQTNPMHPLGDVTPPSVQSTVGTVTNPIKVKPKFLNLGLKNTSQKTAVWEQIEQLLSIEPAMMEAIRSFPERKPRIHLQGFSPIVAKSIFMHYDMVSDVVMYSEQRAAEYDAEVALCFSMMRQHHINTQTLHACPYLGFNKKWYTKDPRPVSVVVVIDKEFNASFKEAFPDATIFDSKRLTMELNETELDGLLNTFAAADFVLTDTVGAVLLATATNVRKIIHLDMYGVADNHGLMPHVKTFKRNQQSLDAQYKQLIDFAQTELKTYERYPSILNQGNAQDFIRNKALTYCRGYGLDVGSNKWPLYGALPSDVDSRKFDQGPFDFIFSSHCLEHIKNWREELDTWNKALKPNGIVFLYLPHPAMEMWIPGGPWCGAWHEWNPDPVLLHHVFQNELKYDILEYSTYPDTCWSFYFVARKR